MSYMKQQYENEHPEIFGPASCVVCKVPHSDMTPLKPAGNGEWICADCESWEPVEQAIENASVVRPDPEPASDLIPFEDGEIVEIKRAPRFDI